MGKKRNPAGDMLHASVAAGMMLIEAHSVIAMRMWGLAGMWNLGPGENTRMWQEKAHAVRQSGAALTRAVMTGATPGEAALAALHPVRRRTRANVQRLTRRGPAKVG